MPKPRKKQASKPVAKVTPKKRGGEWHERFLALFAISLNVGLSAQGAGVDRRQVYRERERNAEFAALMDDAKQAAIERLEAAAYKRAETQSDTLTIFLLKAHKPEIYRENIQQQHTGGLEIVVKHVTTEKADRD